MIDKLNNSTLATQESPHYYEMTLPNGSKRCCGTLKDVECILSIYPTAVYNKILLPAPPDTVDVSSVDLGKDKELAPQLILDESQLEPLDLA